jgi:hypothetical protein
LNLKNRFKNAWTAFTNETTLIDPEEWLVEALGGRISNSGIIINQKKALQCVAAYACVNVISSTLACTPIHVYRTDGNGGRKRDREHPVDYLLSTEWNEWLTAYRGGEP